MFEPDFLAHHKDLGNGPFSISERDRVYMGWDMAKYMDSPPAGWVRLSDAPAAASSHWDMGSACSFCGAPMGLHYIVDPKHATSGYACPGYLTIITRIGQPTEHMSLYSVDFCVPANEAEEVMDRFKVFERSDATAKINDADFFEEG